MSEVDKASLLLDEARRKYYKASQKELKVRFKRFGWIIKTLWLSKPFATAEDICLQ